MCFHGEDGKNLPALGYSIMVVKVNNDDNDGGEKMSCVKAQKQHCVPFVNTKLK